jgi:predicted membrane protein
MSKQGQILLGIFLLVWGGVSILGAFFQVNTWMLCWPTLLILLGVWLLVQPRLFIPGTSIRFRPLGDINMSGSWDVHDEEIWMFVGDADLDFSQAHLPEGETTIRLAGFIGDINLKLPPEAGLAIRGNAFVTSAKINRRSQDSFLTGLVHYSQNYQSTSRKIHLITTFFICDLSVQHLPELD